MRGEDREETRGRGETRNSGETLTEAFWSVARTLRHVSKEALAPYDVSPSQSRAIGVLARHGDMRPGELARHLRIAPRSATEVVDDLESRDLVERSPDPADRRATIVRLTAAGAEVAGAIRAARAAEAEDFFGRLGAGDRAELIRILHVLRDAPEDPPSCPARPTNRP
ncbi:DNA-binding MarR family transcriptional regulator [Pseudonocardia sediminis]|uniref:DNA-binding MarR family transcriptional regulator n=1 Tax=Pseudonocardia sediminis TaxID=1397368 RepID=A0A4Q7UXX8_PSEST|nr:MarR family winged helix-turn-helix transcriptional regulator [Pseudonocardia sediminis]RZT86645.1 DNA-binding MarR family transcriptional regulator [Pseudonocardia sediminis]